MSTTRSLAAQSRHLGRAECEALAKRVLGFSKADEARVSINSGNRGNTRFAVNQVSTAGDNYNTSVSIASYFGKRRGVVNTNTLDDDSLRAAVEMSERLARLAPEDPEHMPELGPQEYAQGRAWSEATAALAPDSRAAAASAITTPARAAGLVSTGYLETRAGSSAIANTNGLFAWERETELALTTTVRTTDGTGSGWAGATSHDWAQLDPAALGARAIDKAQRSVNPAAIEPGRYTVILEPTAVGNLVQFIANSMNQRSADEGRSFFSKAGGGNKIGLKVVDERVSLISDPLDPECYSSTFTGDGQPVGRTVFIENGVVKTLACDRYWAQKTGTEPVPGAGSLRMTGGDASIDDLIASTERGILVTRFWYIRGVDPRTILYTGLTRDGTFLVENGKITRAVKNLRFNESPIFMLNNLEAMGKPVRVSASEAGGPGRPIVVPPIKVRDFTFTSLSDAI
ncbi:MAG TPA: TldD/PmbA family protein [Gemmatimonadaceae bacterium]|nr:TldD/PmbA family protein [Gemmatimonadaceae bacterium]